jgi:hypothetical protein
VCIHVIKPRQFPELLASWHNRWIDSPFVITGFATIFTGISGEADNARVIAVACCSTFFRVSGP